MARKAKFSKQSLVNQANEWILSKWGRRFRIGTLLATVTIYPTYYLVMNGPLVKYWFRRKFDTEDLSDYLQNLTKEELAGFRTREDRKERDSVVRFSIQKDLQNVDSVSLGSLGVRFGAQIGLPMVARFGSKAEAEQYCASHLEPLRVKDSTVCVVWNTKFGKELADTFSLSENALRFLISRDIISRDGYQAFANAAISWATWTTFSSLFTYWIHFRKSKGFARFVICYALFTTMAVLAHIEWHKLYKYMTEVHADNTAARISAQHCLGGMEYYIKLLRRHQLLRSVMDDGPKYFSHTGDCYGTATRYLIRYSGLKDLKEEFAELATVSEGDVF